MAQSKSHNRSTTGPGAEQKGEIVSRILGAGVVITCLFASQVAWADGSADLPCDDSSTISQYSIQSQAPIAQLPDDWVTAFKAAPNDWQTRLKMSLKSNAAPPADVAAMMTPEALDLYNHGALDPEHLFSGSETTQAVLGSSSSSFESIALGGLYDFIKDTAQQELEQYAIQFLEKDLCGTQDKPDPTAAYFPNTCEAIRTYQSSSLTGFNIRSAIVSPLEQDVKTLPACVMKRRLRSSYGYVMLDVYRQLSAATPSTSQNLANLLYGMTKQQTLQTDCATPYTGVVGNIKLDTGFACSSLQVSTVLAALLEVDASKALPAVSANRVSALEVTWYHDLLTRCTATSAPTCTDYANAVLSRFYVIAATSDKKQLVIQNNFNRIASSWLALKEQLSDRSSNILQSETTLRAIAGGDKTDAKAQLAGALAAFSEALDSVYQTAACQLLNQGRPASGAACVPQGQVAAILKLAGKLPVAYSDFTQHQYAAGLLTVAPLVACASDSGDCGGAAASGTPSGTMYTLGLASELAESKTSDDFEKTLQQWSSAFGGWELKTKGTLFTVNSAFGGQVGYESLKAPGYSSSGTAYGLYVPVGIGFSAPTFNSCYFGATLVVLDVGSLASASTSSSASGTHSGFAQVLSPGVNLYHTILGPVVGGLSYSWRTPGLRDVTLSDGTSVRADSRNRWGVFIAVDVPIFPIR